MSTQSADTSRPPTLLGLFLIFSRIGLTSFGGGVSGWLLREFVQDRDWISEEDFLNGLAISQALPGINVKNMAIWIGHRLLGWRGALLAVTGIIMWLRKRADKKALEGTRGSVEWRPAE